MTPAHLLPSKKDRSIRAPIQSEFGTVRISCNRHRSIPGERWSNPVETALDICRGSVVVEVDRCISERKHTPQRGDRCRGILQIWFGVQRDMGFGRELRHTDSGAHSRSCISTKESQPYIFSGLEIDDEMLFAL